MHDSSQTDFLIPFYEHIPPYNARAHVGKYVRVCAGLQAISIYYKEKRVS